MGQLWDIFGQITKIPTPFDPDPPPLRRGAVAVMMVGYKEPRHAAFTITHFIILGVTNAKSWWASVRLFQKRESGSCVLR